MRKDERREARDEGRTLTDSETQEVMGSKDYSTMIQTVSCHANFEALRRIRIQKMCWKQGFHAFDLMAKAVTDQTVS